MGDGLHDDDSDDFIEKLPPPYFVPRYGELALFLMSLAFVLVLVFYDGVRDWIVEELILDWDPRSWIVTLIAGAGIAYSILHVFSRRRMTSLEKDCMLLFAVLVNGFSGIAAGWHILSTSSFGILIIFPIWNIIQGGMLLLLYRLDVVDETSIVDDDTKPREVVLGSVVLVVAFALCTFVFDLYWAVTYSICVAYATTLSRFLDRWPEFFLRLGR